MVEKLEESLARVKEPSQERYGYDVEFESGYELDDGKHWLEMF